jgi:hypothetical protein
MRYYLPWGIRYSSRYRRQALSLRLCTYMNLMSLSPGVLIVPWTDLLQIRHLQTSNKKINLWSDASDYQSTQDFRHCSTRPANESKEKKRKKKTPKLQKLHMKIPETQILLLMPLNPVCLKSQIEFAMNQRCPQKYKTQYKNPWKSLRSGWWNNPNLWAVW